MLRTDLGRVRRDVPPAIVPALILAASALLCSCGLETVTIYESPDFSQGSGLLTLTHNTANDADPSFLGYEIYYRAYDTYEAANSARATVQAAIDQSLATPEACMSTLASLKFRRITDYSGSDQRPLFKRSSFVSDKLTIFYGSSWYVNEFSPDEHKPIWRWTKKPFNSEYSHADDEDFSGSDNLTVGETAYFVLFAVAYGFYGTADFKEIYSFPKGAGGVISAVLAY